MKLHYALGTLACRARNNYLTKSLFVYFKARLKSLAHAMTRIGFEVFIIKNEGRAKKILKIIAEFAHNNDQWECNAFGVAFMSHGGANGEMVTYFDTINVEQIIESVKGSKALVGKPKLFFFQG